MSCRTLEESAELGMGENEDDEGLVGFMPVSTPGGLLDRGRSLKKLGEYLAKPMELPV